MFLSWFLSEFKCFISFWMSGDLLNLTVLMKVSLNYCLSMFFVLRSDTPSSTSIKFLTLLSVMSARVSEKARIFHISFFPGHKCSYLAFAEMTFTTF